VNDKDLIQHLTMLLSAKDEQISSLSRQIEQLSLSLSESNKETQRIVSDLSATIKKLSKQLYGSKSEKLSKLNTKAKEETAQVSVPEHKVNQQDSSVEQQPAVEKAKQTKPLRRVYECLEERVIVLEPQEDTTGARLLREEEIIRYSYIPPKIIRTIYKRLIYGNGDKVFTAPFPSHLIERCLADISLLAAITVNKFGYHIPIQRQLEIFKNIGIDWSKSTVNSWVVRIIQILAPIFEELEKQVIKSSYLNIDETTIPILIKGKSKTKKGYIWGVVSPETGLMSFKYDQGSRSSKVLEDILENYTGTIQSDGYAAYKNIGKGKNGKRIRRIACLAHIRRAFFESEPTDPRAREGLEYISRLYSVEKVCYDPERSPDESMTEEQITQYRLTHSVPILKEFYRWIQCKSRDESVLPRGTFGKAVTYALNEFPFLINYLRKGSYRIDNNAAERVMRAPVLGRKNYMFCGEHAGGKRAAQIYSLIASCKMNNINPIAYLEDILARLMDHNHLKLHELLPNEWTPLQNNLTIKDPQF
jgi:transposase